MADNTLFETHFTEGRRYRVEEHLEVLGHANWWRRATFGIGVLALISVLGNLYLGAQPKLIPYPIRWDSTSGEMRPLALAMNAGHENVTVRLWLREMVATLRGISTDKELMRVQWNTAMARATREGKAKLVTYQAEIKPLEQQEPVRVEVLRMIRKTDQTWDVRWQETRFSKDGEPKATAVYSGLFTFQACPPRTQTDMDYNPAGICWKEWGWSLE